MHLGCDPPVNNSLVVKILKSKQDVPVQGSKYNTKHNDSNQLIDHMTNELIYHVTNELINHAANQLIDHVTNQQIDHMTNELIDHLTNELIEHVPIS